MLPMIVMPSEDSAERSRRLSTQEMRFRALERLYERKVAVENLIQSLEDYRNSPSVREPEVAALSVARSY